MPANTVWLKGHSAGVTCLEAQQGAEGRLLASGSDDGTVRLWDCHAGRSVRCLNVTGREEVAGIAWCGPDVLAAASEAGIHYTDLRQHGDTIVISTPQMSIRSEQEVQCLSATGSAESPLAVAAGMEDGSLLLCPRYGTPNTPATLHPHGNVVSGIAHCRHDPTLLWSAAMDCTLSLTRIPGNSAPPSFSKIEMPNGQFDDPNAGKVINPPFPSCLSACPTTGRAAVGLMNGTLWVFDTDVDVEAMWPIQGDVPIEAVAWASEQHLDHIWTADRSGYVGLYRMAEPLPEDSGDEGEGCAAAGSAANTMEVDTAEGGAAEQQDEEIPDEDAAAVVTAVRCPEAVSALCHTGWLHRLQVITADVSGDIAIHTLPPIAQLSC